MIECSSYQIDLAPSLDPLDRHPAQRHARIISTATARSQDYAAIKERLVAGVQADGTAIVGVDDNWCQAVADRIERAGKRVVRVSVRRPLSDGLYVEAEQVMQAAGGTARAVAQIGGIGSLRGAHNAQNAACATAAALALGLSAEAIQQGLRSFPGPRAPHGAGRPQGQRAVRQRLQGDQRRRRGARARELRRHLLDRRRQAEDRRHHVARPATSRASARPT